MNRREWLGATAALAAIPPLSASKAEDSRETVREIGSRRELFVDRYLIDRLEGGIAMELERPRDEGPVLAFDRPWEGAFCGYATVFQDGDRIRLYYRGLQKAGQDGSRSEGTCYAESKDGRVWTRPALGLFEYEGSRENNLILADQPPFSHNFCPMRDPRPDIPPEERYKALAGTATTGLVAFASPDGLRWKRVGETPAITQGAFDSQNVPFWSEQEQCYLCYLRVFVDKIRRIARATSRDFRHWSEPVLMGYGDRPAEHLYTNQTNPYPRAPHLYLGIAARFEPGRRVITDEEARAIGVDPRYTGDCSDAVLITSRGGDRYDRAFMEGFLIPGIGPRNWVSRTNYPALGLIQTGDTELSFYANQDYGQPTAHLRRYALRLDGFACLRASYDGGEMISAPLTFQGKELALNLATSAAGGIRVEIQNPDGTPIPGFSLADSVETIGNEIDRVARWKGGADLSALAGRPIRLHLAMKDARLYALQFRA